MPESPVRLPWAVAAIAAIGAEPSIRPSALSPPPDEPPLSEPFGPLRGSDGPVPNPPSAAKTPSFSRGPENPPAG